MTFVQRVAMVAAISLTLTGFGGVGTAGNAADINRTFVVVQPAAQPLPDTLTTPTVPPVATIDPSASSPATVDTTPVDDNQFASLSDAVDAQDQEAGDDTVRCLATAVYFEAKSEPMAGQLAVAQVIINRTRSGRFPGDVCGVVKQRGQFSFVRGGALPAINAKLAQYRTALKIAKVAIAEAWQGPARTALYFNGRRGAGLGRAVVASIGNHIFYR